MGKTHNWIVISIVVISLLLGISIAFRSQTAIIQFFSIDDAFYYFQVAKNIAAGNGITFDGIARGNGYHPLWMAICVPVFALAKLDLWLPLRTLIVLQSLIHTAAGFLIYRLLLKKVSSSLSILAMAVWLFSPSIFLQSGSAGLETGINILCITALLYSLSLWSDLDDQNSTKKYWVAGIFAALTLLARLDNIYLLCFLGAWLVLENTHLNRKGVFSDFFLIAIGVIFSYAAYIGLNPLYYRMMPQIKMILVSSMIVFPLGQFLVGNYHEDDDAFSKKAIAFRGMVGALVSTMFEFLLVQFIFPNVGYSRIALLLQCLFFAGATVLAKMVSVGKENNSEAPNMKVNFRWVQAVEWKNLITQGMAYFVPVFSALGAFLVFNHFYFGSAMPLSGKIKAWWGTLSTVYGRPATTLASFVGLNEQGPWFVVGQWIKPIADKVELGENWSGLVYPLLVGVFLLLIFVLVLKSKKLRESFSSYLFVPFALGVIFHAGYYTMTGYVGYRSWYWAVERLFVLLFFVLLIAVLLEKIAGRLPFLQKKWIDQGAVVALVLISLIVFVRFNVSKYPVGVDNEPVVYLRNMRILEEVTDSGSLIGMTGGGVEAYFIKDRTIVNMDGLINGMEYFDALTSMELDTYLDKIGVDYVLGKEVMLLDSEPYMMPMAGRLEFLDLPEVEFDDYMRLYRFVPEQ